MELEVTLSSNIKTEFNYMSNRISFSKVRNDVRRKNRVNKKRKLFQDITPFQVKLRGNKLVTEIVSLWINAENPL